MKKYIGIFLILSSIIFLACACVDAQNKEPDNLDVRAIEDGNELTFNFSIDDFINQYNAYSDEEYLTPADDALSYSFSEDETVSVLPELTISASAENNFVQRIVVSFDWHSFSDALLEKYNDMCNRSLKIVYPEMSDEQISKLCSDVIDTGYDHPQEKRYRTDSVPYAIYYKGNIGVCSYFALGDRQYLCIIPVTKELITEFANKGVNTIDYSIK